MPKNIVFWSSYTLGIQKGYVPDDFLFFFFGAFPWDFHNPLKSAKQMCLVYILLCTYYKTSSIC